ncbi:Copia protein [Vitis vinifera]|uniref:Copia protein n=1 Tax=Vitis vinifera TaxID=29760 RepID=A0A438GCH5_VITVI|nr:Copia protein [Vitis vinifera]
MWKGYANLNSNKKKSRLLWKHFKMSNCLWLFKELEKTVTSKVRIGNGAYLAVKGKRTVAIEGHTGLKLISNVLYVHEINQNLLSIGQLLEKSYKVLFEDNHCIIADAQGREVFIVQMKGKSFTLDLMQEEQAEIHKEESNTMLWHRRLGHFHHTAFLFMKKNDLREGLHELERDKLDKKAEVGIFIGYSLISKAYRIYFPENNKVIVGRDVKLFELESWSWEDDKKLEFKENLEFQKDLEFQEENDNIDDELGMKKLQLIKKWMDAMKEELKMIEKNQTWELVDKLIHKRAIRVKWVYRTKLNSNGSINKHKARLVVKGYAQMFRVDFSETFALVARLDTIRMLLALAAQNDWNMHQMDVKSAFLNGYLEEDIFVDQLEGFIVKGMEEKVYLLKKALKVCDETLVVSLYVDDLLVIGSSMEQIDNFKKEMKDVFEMIDLGRMTFFLGMKMEECNPSATPMNQNEKFCKEDGTAKAYERLYRTIIECLMYLTTTRLDIMNVVSLLSRYMHCASEVHFQAAKRIVRYVKDSDWAGYVDDMRSTSGYCFNFGFAIFSWCSKKQEVIAQSTTEAEYVVATVAINQALWIRKLMADLFMEQKESTQILLDNQATISIANNPVFHGKTKHL